MSRSTDHSILLLISCLKLSSLGRTQDKIKIKLGRLLTANVLNRFVRRRCEGLCPVHKLRKTCHACGPQETPYEHEGIEQRNRPLPAPLLSEPSRESSTAVMTFAAKTIDCISGFIDPKYGLWAASRSLVEFAASPPFGQLPECTAEVGCFDNLTLHSPTFYCLALDGGVQAGGVGQGVQWGGCGAVGNLAIDANRRN
jgi:hypothetical protein